MRVLITGGTGLIGKVLCRVLLADGHEVIVLSRNPEAQKDSLPRGVHIHKWDGRSAGGWGHLIHRESAIINLAGGYGAALHWSDTHKQPILESRIAAGQGIVEAIKNAPEKPRVLLQASSVSYYGDCENDIVIEDSPTGEDWRAQVCQEWEQVTGEIDVRQCILRMGVVLDIHGGALPLMMLGSCFHDKQTSSARWIPWIHNLDVALSLRFLMKHETASGAFNIVAPNPQTNAVILQTLRNMVKESSSNSTSALCPAPDEMPMTALDSQRVIPYRLSHLGYKFRFPAFEDALRHLFL